MLTTIGRIYYELSRFDESRPLLQEAVAVARRLPASESRTLGSTLSERGQLAAAHARPGDVRNLLHALASVLVPVSIQFLWRPQLRDPNDDMVLELAVNGLGRGQPVTLVTFNQRDFLPQATRFGIPVIGPAQFFQGV